MVKLRETAELYSTLNEAIIAAENDGRNDFTLEVIGDVTETSNVRINSNITIVADEGQHTVTLSSNNSILVENDATLTLGDGTNTNTLTILRSVNVTNGTININDGIIIKSDDIALNLRGANVNGTISGGYLEGEKTAINIGSGAQLSEISGGEFKGKQEAIHLSDTGAKIEKISGGAFYQTDPDMDLHGQAIFMQNNSQIGEISGGYFEAAQSSAIWITRGSFIGEISGGEFLATRVGSFANNDRNATIWIESENEITGIGKISGGYFHGTNFGVLVIRRYPSSYSQIDKITGGRFEGSVGLQIDSGCVVNEITGGEFRGSQGILNVGTIGLIGKGADIHGTSSYAIYNYSGGIINEISGGMMVSDQSHGILNAGTIELISGGTIIGRWSAINCDGMNKGRLNTISGGVFWGKYDDAINLAYELQLEPGLGAIRGFARFWGSNGVIFNNESLVVYPTNAQIGIKYYMSTETIPVEGIVGTEFKYLTIDNYTVTVNGSHADDRGTGNYLQDDIVTIRAGIRAGCVFAGWTSDDDVQFADASSAVTTFVMPDKNVVVNANWECKSSVTVNDSFATDSGAGEYAEGKVVTINAGRRRNCKFVAWTTRDKVNFDDAQNPTTTFIMPDRDVTVTANWCCESKRPKPPFPKPDCCCHCCFCCHYCFWNHIENHC